MIFIKRFVVFSFISFVSLACTPMIDTHGDVLSSEDMALFTVGKTSAEEVEKVLGTPSARTLFDTQDLIYIHALQERKAFFKPQETERKVTFFQFDKEGILTDIQVRTLAQGRKIKPAPESKTLNEKTLSILDQMMSNAGKMGADTPVH